MERMEIEDLGKFPYYIKKHMVMRVNSVKYINVLIHLIDSCHRKNSKYWDIYF